MPRTLTAIFLDAVSTHRKPDQFLRKRAGVWESISAARALEDVETLALGLAERGIVRGDHVALLSETRYEWPVADLAILGLGAVTVPLYPTLTAEQCAYVLANSEARVAFVSTAAQLEKVRAVASRLPRLEMIVCMDAEPSDPSREIALAALMERGRARRASSPDAYRTSAAAVREDDLATIIYTSGTTGEPKGAMLTHGNIAFDVEACLEVVGLFPTDVALSFLPLCHIFERMAGLYTMLQAGATIAYAENFESVAANAIEVRPTILNGVPRFYEKVHARVMENAGRLSPLERRMFDWGMARGVARARAHFQGRRTETLASRVADLLVAKKIRARMGGRLRLCISGGAPLSPPVIEFFFAIGIPVLEGYGLTETSPVICLNVPGRERPGSVGPPVPGVEIAIGEEGEILTCGPHVMRGYFKNESATAAALRDGWFHTGDVGRIDPDGSLVITDRLKDLLVTAGGKKVAPQPLEARLKESPLVSEAVLLGDRRPYIVALLVPEFARLEATARGLGVGFATHAELIARPEVRELYQREIDRLNASLAPFEQIKRFAVMEREFTAERGEITPSLKIKRRVVTEHYAETIEKLYVGRSS
jgi:long-chain acyl-CoA synthetase